MVVSINDTDGRNYCKLMHSCVPFLNMNLAYGRWDRVCYKTGNRGDNLTPQPTAEACAQACKDKHGSSCQLFEWGANWGCFKCDDDASYDNLEAPSAVETATWNVQAYSLITVPRGKQDFDKEMQ